MMGREELGDVLKAIVAQKMVVLQKLAQVWLNSIYTY